MADHSRRQYLATVGGLTGLGTAGCLGDGAQETDSNPNEGPGSNSGSDQGPESSSESESNSKDFEIPEDELTSEYYDTHMDIVKDMDQFHVDSWAGSGEKSDVAVRALADFDNGKILGEIRYFGPEIAWTGEGERPSQKYNFFRPKDGEIFVEHKNWQDGDSDELIVNYEILDPNQTYENDDFEFISQMADEAALRELNFPTNLFPHLDGLEDALEQPVAYDSDTEHNFSGDQCAHYLKLDPSQTRYPLNEEVDEEELFNFETGAYISRDFGAISEFETRYESPETSPAYLGRIRPQDTSIEEPGFARRAKTSQ